MLASLLFAIVVGPQAADGGSYRILFLGNSHTAFNDVPGQVAALLRSGGAQVETKLIAGGHLDDIEVAKSADQDLASRRWTHVVLQGAMISSSHKYEYSQDKAISLAKKAKAGSAVPIYYSEWPRKGWAESDYIFSHYETIRKAAGGENVPVCYAWDAALRADPTLALWAQDGNHATALGSFVAASTIAHWIAGPDKRLWSVPRGVDPQQARTVSEAARKTVTEWRKKQG